MQPSTVQLFHYPRILRLAWLGLIIAISAGVSQRVPAAEAGRAEATVTGQIFTIGSGGESIRLGAVQVQVFPQAVIEAHLEERLAVLRRTRRILDDRVAEIREELDKEKARFEALVAEGDQRKSAAVAEIAALREEARKRIASIDASIAANEKEIAFWSDYPEPPPGIPLREEYEAYAKLRDRWLAVPAAERAAWTSALRGLTEELLAERAAVIAERDQAVEAAERDRKSIDADIAARQERQAKLRADLDEAIARAEQAPDFSALLAGLPKAAADTRTDASGEFQLNIPSDEPYVIFARTERRFSGEVRELTWLVRIGVERPLRVLLSDHNLVTAHSPDNVLDLKQDESRSNT